MAIQVTCPGCHKRFQVSDVHAGKSGNCPSCKGPIRVPTKEEEVVIHAPESFGPKDASGRATLKPLEREEFKLTPVMMAVIAGTVLLMFALAFLLGRTAGDTGPSRWLLGLGAFIVAPPICLAGYSVLRNEELGAHQGNELWLRVIACAIGYAVLWGGYALVNHFVLGGTTPEMFQLAFLVPIFLAVGGGIALAALELDFTNGCLHYAFYLLVTVLLRMTMGLGPV